VLSVLLRFTDSDYPFGIFKLSQKPALYLSTSVAEEYIYLKHTLQFRETTKSYSITTYLLHVINKTNFWNSNFATTANDLAHYSDLT